jgi:phosphonatase-like hydrolase
MDFRLVVFDMAGTTVHDEGWVAQALMAATAADGCEVSFDAAQAMMGYTKPGAIEHLLLAAGQSAPAERVMRIHSDFVARMLDTYRHDPRVMPIDGAEETFQVLHRAGVRVALNTAFSRTIADAIVTRLRWREAGLIDAFICADEVAEGRPAADMIHSLMARSGIRDARQVVKVGDTAIDIHEGRNAGCGLVVAVSTGAYTRERLAEHAPDKIIDHLDQLMPLMQASPAAATS